MEEHQLILIMGKVNSKSCFHILLNTYFGICVFSFAIALVKFFLSLIHFYVPGM